MRGLYWWRSDLRIHDNLALLRLCEECESCLFVWCPSDSYLRAGPHRKSFIDDCVSHLARELKKFDQFILVHDKNAVQVLPALIEEYKIEVTAQVPMQELVAG